MDPGDSEMQWSCLIFIKMKHMHPYTHPSSTWMPHVLLPTELGPQKARGWVNLTPNAPRVVLCVPQSCCRFLIYSGMAQGFVFLGCGTVCNPTISWFSRRLDKSAKMLVSQSLANFLHSALNQSNSPKTGKHRIIHFKCLLWSTYQANHRLSELERTLSSPWLSHARTPRGSVTGPRSHSKRVAEPNAASLVCGLLGQFVKNFWWKKDLWKVFFLLLLAWLLFIQDRLFKNQRF